MTSFEWNESGDDAVADIEDELEAAAAAAVGGGTRRLLLFLLPFRCRRRLLAGFPLLDASCGLLPFSLLLIVMNLSQTTCVSSR